MSWNCHIFEKSSILSPLKSMVREAQRLMSADFEVPMRQIISGVEAAFRQPSRVMED